MNKVFIGGSRKISRINRKIRQYLDQLIRDECYILIGDANGVDKSIQLYFKNRNYNNIEVFCMDDNCRNNIGDWTVRHIYTKIRKKNLDYYSVKDEKMAEEASTGLMVWDGKSFGTVANIFRLIKQNKRVDTYIVQNKEFLTLNSTDDLNKLLSECTGELRERISNYFKENNNITMKQGNLFEISF